MHSQTHGTSELEESQAEWQRSMVLKNSSSGAR